MTQEANTAAGIQVTPVTTEVQAAPVEHATQPIYSVDFEAIGKTEPLPMETSSDPLSVSFVSKNKDKAVAMQYIQSEFLEAVYKEGDIDTARDFPGRVTVFNTYEGPGQRKVLNIGGNKAVAIVPMENGIKLDALDIKLEYNPVRKIPVAILREILAHGRYVYKKHFTEFAYQIYRKPDGSYVAYYPSQHNTGANVNYSADKLGASELRTKWELVLEGHTHANMNAFFSGGDDDNEKFPMVFICIGKFAEKQAMFVGRFKYLKWALELKLGDVFDLAGMTEAEALNLENLDMSIVDAEKLEPLLLGPAPIAVAPYGGVSRAPYYPPYGGVNGNYGYRNQWGGYQPASGATKRYVALDEDDLYMGHGYNYYGNNAARPTKAQRKAAKKAARFTPTASLFEPEIISAYLDSNDKIDLVAYLLQNMDAEERNKLVKVVEAAETAAISEVPAEEEDTQLPAVSSK